MSPRKSLPGGFAIRRHIRESEAGAADRAVTARCLEVRCGIANAPLWQADHGVPRCVPGFDGLKSACQLSADAQHVSDQGLGV